MRSPSPTATRSGCRPSPTCSSTPGANSSTSTGTPICTRSWRGMSRPARVVYRICSIDGFVAWEGNAYAVPYAHVTDILPVRITQDELFVYAADLSCVARHELAPRGKGLRLDPQGLHPRPGRQSPVDL